MSEMVSTPDGRRFAPAGPAHLYKTYGASLPLATHWVPATCAEIDCEAYQYGWVTTLDLSTDLGQRQYEFCTHDKTRSHTEYRPGGTLVELTYPAGTTCFTAGDHKRPVERPPVFYTRRGDWRGDPTGGRPFVHKRPEDWVDDMATNLDRLNAEIEKG